MRKNGCEIKTNLENSQKRDVQTGLLDQNLKNYFTQWVALITQGCWSRTSLL